MQNKKRNALGFTLLEILVALFIFTILSSLLAVALHNIIGIEERTHQHAERLRDLQVALLILSRDIEQTVDRSVLNSAGKEDPAFIGSPTQFTLTHTGVASGSAATPQSNLQRNTYLGQGDQLVRLTYAVLDQSGGSVPIKRVLLDHAKFSFEYLDKDGRFHQNWPVSGKKDEKIPRAVRVYISLPDLGRMSQLYIT